MSIGVPPAVGTRSACHVLVTRRLLGERDDDLVSERGPVRMHGKLSPERHDAGV